MKYTFIILVIIVVVIFLFFLFRQRGWTEGFIGGPPYTKSVLSSFNLFLTPNNSFDQGLLKATAGDSPLSGGSFPADDLTKCVDDLTKVVASNYTNPYLAQIISLLPSISSDMVKTHEPYGKYMSQISMDLSANTVHAISKKIRQITQDIVNIYCVNTKKSPISIVDSSNIESIGARFYGVVADPSGYQSTSVKTMARVFKLVLIKLHDMNISYVTKHVSYIENDVGAFAYFLSVLSSSQSDTKPSEAVAEPKSGQPVVAEPPAPATITSSPTQPSAATTTLAGSPTTPPTATETKTMQAVTSPPAATTTPATTNASTTLSSVPVTANNGSTASASTGSNPVAAAPAAAAPTSSSLSSAPVATTPASAAPVDTNPAAAPNTGLPPPSNEEKPINVIT